ncbi:hypothetical protein PR202_gb17100 [Eleusine coracana subsp. coracana]|uniref:DUF7797 domain-containing protein n=1 Tax=Eleusine coracana subsp. coracana TaxID=191504 RepID=A0AAV5F247_ELECO|nr:hypothetical protein PR202_gb17100 [Eleusine coracana subsp. coracana]
MRLTHPRVPHLTAPPFRLAFTTPGSTSNTTPHRKKLCAAVRPPRSRRCSSDSSSSSSFHRCLLVTSPIKQRFPHSPRRLPEPSRTSPRAPTSLLGFRIRPPHSPGARARAMGAGQKPRRGGGELAQVAEMVMVLAAAGEARGGWDPTVAERALAAEAMSKLAAAVEEVAQPRELVPKEAVCALVEDLGLGRARDPAAMGYRPRRASIAERVLHTKRKVSRRFSPLAGLYAVTRSPFPMEEVNESFVHSTTNMPKTTSSSAITGSQQGASESTGSPWNLSNPVTAPVISNQPLLNGTIAGASYVKPANIPSIASLLRVGSADIKVEKSVNGSQVTEHGGNVTCTTPTDEIHQAHGLTNNGIKKAHEQEMLANDAISTQGNVQQVNLNGQIYSDCEIAGDPKDGFVGCSTSSIVDWVGDVLKAVDNKTYYNSCSIDGLIYNLHDNILIASEGSRASPCKLQVYGSNDQKIILLTAIRGPCEAIKEKKECFKYLYLDKSAANIEGYKIAKRAAKRAVSVAKGQTYDNLYQRLGTKEGEKDIYRMARIRERKTRDINQIKCIKDGIDRLLVRDDEIKDRWREYFDKLFNGEEEGSILELDDSFNDNNRRFVRRIQEAEIEQALKRMKSGKAMGPDGIPIEV